MEPVAATARQQALPDEHGLAAVPVPGLPTEAVTMPPEPAAIAARRGTWYGTCPRCRRPLSLTSDRSDHGHVVSSRCRACPPAEKEKPK
ncbi:hypothetical protein JW613_11210 [Streptomyces smyrnaeus]|uniref:Uncharacterized protein n=1 Tax=Streptomyces smyrnaeus TaxID=1387713 RepID=A0ABS3XU68_9ACTN|nr:hypothetical protein [Streptomyces smyrnaeus]MBO8198871.1 hypothetical protein [Streptomyces smyrnaeus]